MKRDWDTSGRLCKWLNIEVWGDSQPCKMFERFDDSFR